MERLALMGAEDIATTTAVTEEKQVFVLYGSHGAKISNLY